MIRYDPCFIVEIICFFFSFANNKSSTSACTKKRALTRNKSHETPTSVDISNQLTVVKRGDRPYEQKTVDFPEIDEISSTKGSYINMHAFKNISVFIVIYMKII